MRRAEAGALGLLALAAVALLNANNPQSRSELAETRALRLPEPLELNLPDPGYQTGFPQVRDTAGQETFVKFRPTVFALMLCSRHEARVAILTVQCAELFFVGTEPDRKVCLGVPRTLTARRQP